MAFRFTLEAVRRLRRSLEDRERLSLEKLLAQRTAVSHEIEHLHAASLDGQQQLQRTLITSPIPAAEIQFNIACLDAMGGRQKDLQGQLLKLQVAIAEQTSRFQGERQKREALDVLRDAQLRDFRTQQSRREQIQLDELHLLERVRRTRT